MKHTDAPVLLITLGPTGSGKSSIPSKVAKILKLKNHNFEEALIDNLVENHKNYKSKVKKFIDERRNEYKENKLGDDDMLINNFTSHDIEKTIDFFNDSYFETRKQVDCVQTNTNNDSHSDIINCDAVNDEILANALNKGQNVVFETTGEYYPYWLFTNEKYKEKIQEHKYQIVFAMNVVEICELINRNYNRAKESLKNFMTDYTKPAPRLPDMDFNNFRKKIEKIVDTFNTNVYSARCNDIYKECKIRKFVFDNNTRDGKTLYDSGDKNFDTLKAETILNKYQLNKEMCDQPGGKRKSRRRNKNKQTRKRKSKNNRRRNTRRR